LELKQVQKKEKLPKFKLKVKRPDKSSFATTQTNLKKLVMPAQLSDSPYVKNFEEQGYEV
jgi:hypothetical protein